jgi:AhpD family alkylhydroperoxidase
MPEEDKLLEEMGEKIGFTPQILETLKDLDPKFVHKYGICNRKVLSDGALPAKVKALMALAVVASKQCEVCTVSQMKNALNNGATKEEIMETMDVIFITSGAPAISACRDALKLVK